MYIITGYKDHKNGYDLRGARIYLIEGDRDCKEVLTFKQPTAKGWESKKPIIADFTYVEDESRDIFVCRCLVISDEVASQLIAKYLNVEVKTFSRPDDGSMAKILALCEYMHDPYDQSGSFSDTSLSKGMNNI